MQSVEQNSLGRILFVKHRVSSDFCPTLYIYTIAILCHICEERIAYVCKYNTSVITQHFFYIQK